MSTRRQRSKTKTRGMAPEPQEVAPPTTTLASILNDLAWAAMSRQAEQERISMVHAKAEARRGQAARAKAKAKMRLELSTITDPKQAKLARQAIMKELRHV